MFKVFALATLGALVCFGQAHTFTNGSDTITSNGSATIMSGDITWTPATATMGTISGGSVWLDSRGNIVSATPSTPRKPRLPILSSSAIRATAHAVPASMIASPAYLQLAKKISLKSAPIDESELGALLNAHGFTVYDPNKVDDYLFDKAIAAGPRVEWVWKPMRTSDQQATRNHTHPISSPSGMGWTRDALYAQEVPAKVLEKVACLLEDMPDAIFFVSDYETRKPDPFLAVTTPRMIEEGRLLIIDQWDEPGFGAPTEGKWASIPRTTVTAGE